MGTQKFRITVTMSAIVELNQRVIDAVDDEWRENLYDLNTPEEIANMIGRSMLVYRSKLSDLDGWADMPNDYAKLSYIDIESVTEKY